MKTSLTRFALFFALVLLLSFKAQAITITSFAPAVGAPGTLVTVTGTGFTNITTFTIGGQQALVISNTGTKLVGMVMPGTTSGNITLVNASGKAISKTNFYMVPIEPPFGQGNILSAKDTVGAGAQGSSIAMDGTGSTIISGGPKDSLGTGAVWVFNHSLNQTGHKLVGKNFIGKSAQGTSVAVSIDGNTAIVGGPGDNNNNGAVWVFHRDTNQVWKQQGAKLTINGVNGGMLGSWVSVSADGNTLVAEAAGDNNNAGAAYVFSRTDTTWAQQGGKLIATGSAAAPGNITGDQRVAISGDGNTIVMGAHTATAGMGSAWIFTRTNNTWTQQGSRLVGTNAVGQPNQGSAVAISADGKTIAVGGYTDDSNRGAVWTYQLKNNTWSQIGNKIVSKDTAGYSQQGCSLALNADGTILVIGGKADANYTGANWIFMHTDTTSATWTQYLQKWVGLNATAGSMAATSVAISAPGRFMATGGPGYNASHGAGWICGGDGSGIACPLAISTKNATSIKSRSATLNGSVDQQGCEPTIIAFEIATLADMSNSTVAQPTSGTTPYIPSNGTLAFSSAVTKLLPSTTYYFRIVGANYDAGVIYGNIMQFTTPANDTILVDKPGSGLSIATIPTAFSPNNDGINDTWEIPFLSNYSNASVKVFNRNGQIVFASTGYTSSWDGRYKNTELPAGAYYYVIDLKNNQSKISGSVNLVK